MTTTTLDAAASRTEPSDEGISRLRTRRQELRAERDRTRYLRRLLQARLDLAVADAVGAHVGPSVAELPAGSPVPPSADEVGALLTAGTVCDLGTSLTALREALRRLTRYEDALETACEDVTDDLVDSLATHHRDLLTA